MGNWIRKLFGKQRPARESGGAAKREEPKSAQASTVESAARGGEAGGADSSMMNDDPELCILFGNGFEPTQADSDQMLNLWTGARKNVLNLDLSGGVDIELRETSRSPRSVFAMEVEAEKTLRPGRCTDSVSRLDQRTGRDLALLAVWSPEKSGRVSKNLSGG